MAQKEPIRNFVLHDRHGHDIDFSSFSVVSDVSVTFHAGVGEPYCESRYQGGILYLDFYNIKGEGINSITYDATVEDGGTNYIHISTDGENEYTFPVKNGSRGNGITSIETAESQEDDGYNVVCIHCTDDESEEGTEFRIKNGSRGNGIASVTEEMSDQDGGINTHTIHYTDPNVPDSVFHTRNGSQGRPGVDRQPVESGDVMISQTTGDDETIVMSQKAVTAEIEKIGMASTATPADFEIADENGKAILSVNKGHIKTKHFNSQDIPDIGESDIVESDFALGDGNTDILRIHKGHLYTKNFNSEQVLKDMEILKEERAKFAGKRIAIIGDSISTYQGWLPSDLPDYDGETYANYYPAHGYDVNDVSKTWWHIAASKLGILPENIRNCAWSGSKLTGDSTSTTDASAGCSSRRIADLGIGGYPDIVVIFISCNDFGQNVEVGDWQVNEAIPSEGQITTLREAYALMLAKIITAYPNARIFCCTILDERQRDKTPGWPTNNSVGVSTAEWNRNIAEIANAFGCDIINIHSCGMNYINISGYTCEPDIDRKLHPNAAGMRLIGNRVYNEIKSKY